jgi:3-methyladenine DNA glycosylase Tag
MSKSIVHADGLQRCPWPKQDPLYIHDQEWGVAEFDDRAPAFRGSQFCALTWRITCAGEISSK